MKMTVDTKLPFDQEYILNYSKELGEPEWLKELRVLALQKAAELPMPKPDKTKIDKWNFTQFKDHAVAGTTLTDLRASGRS